MKTVLLTALGVAAVVAITGCDSRGPFIATYNGTDATVITPSGGGTAQNFTTNLNGVEISDSITSGKILVPMANGGCTFPATVSSGTAFTFDLGTVCTFTFSNGDIDTWTVTTGAGTLNTSNNNLTYSISTNISQTSGGSVETATETDTISLTRE